MKKQGPKSYGFTTTPAAVSLDRIAAEAKPRDRFLVVQAKHTHGGASALSVLIRKSALPKRADGLSVLGVPLKKRNWGTPMGKFVALTVPAEPRKIVSLKHDLHRLKNFVDGRVVRVLVEAI